jgi:hypothetical protein
MKVLDFPDLDSTFRTQVVDVLVRLSKQFGRHPECLSITGLQLLGKYAIACGTYGDVWKGIIRGEDVSVKIVRLFKGSEIQALLKVWYLFDTTSLLPTFKFLGLLSGGNYLGPACASECAPIFGHLLPR